MRNESGTEMDVDRAGLDRLPLENHVLLMGILTSKIGNEILVV